MILLDTNVISELLKNECNEDVLRWFDEIPAADVFTTSITVAEFLYGIELMPDGERKTNLSDEIEHFLGSTLGPRILNFNTAVARNYAKITAKRKRLGLSLNVADTMIAACAIQFGASIATRNVTDFDGIGITILNPWETYDV